MSDSTWVVTGASGFVGGHVVEALRRDLPGARVIVAGRRRPSEGLGFELVSADLERRGEWMEEIRSIRPEVVVHAAGRTPPSAVERLYRANVAATAHLLEALAGLPTRVVLVGSAAELGAVPVALLPADEGCRCRPVDPYGLSKWAATRLGLSWRGRTGLDVRVARLFNPIGPGQPGSQVFGRFANRLAGMDISISCDLEVGDVSARRDFVDVRDVARALIAVAGETVGGGIYHVGTGRSRSVGEGFAALVAASGRRVRLLTKEGAAPPALGDSRACVERIVGATGWRPLVSFEESLKDLWASVGGGEGRLVA